MCLPVEVVVGRLRRLARWVVVGRKDGVRAGLRRRLGWFTWLDRSGASEPVPAPAAPAAPTATAADGPPEPVGASPIPEGWVRVARVDELAPGEVIEVLAGDRPVALVNVDGEILGLEGVCPHAGGPLGDGHLDGCRLTCPWHGWTFDVRSGRSEVSEDVSARVWPVRVASGEIWVPAG